MSEADYRAEIVARARGYLGTNYRLYGRGRHEGVDCGGVGFCVGREVGAFAEDWDILDYAFATRGRIWGPWAGCTRIPDSSKAAGDLLVLEGSAGTGRPEVCGILTEPDGPVPRDPNAPGFGYSIVLTRPGIEVVEVPLATLLRVGEIDRGLLGVVYRFDYPPAAARADVRPTSETGDTEPERIR